MPTSTSWAENYLLIAQGPAQYAPYLAGWQEFKDHLRKVIQYQPGWTEVVDGPRKGEKQGWCRIDRRDDAEAAYKQYASAKNILVHLFKTSRSSEEYRMLKCNCCLHFLDLSEQGHSAHRSGINVGGVNQYVSQVRGGSAPSYTAPAPSYTIPAPPMYSYPAYPQASPYAAAYPPPLPYHVPTLPLATPQMPIYAANTSGIPVNARHGAMLTEARGIFISNLNYSIGPAGLNALLSTVGSPVESRLHRDSRTGAFKGNATAQFATKEQAMYAVAHLNQKEHMGMKINVRLDTDATVVGQVQAPIIVNGSVSRA